MTADEALALGALLVILVVLVWDLVRDEIASRP